MSIFCTTHILFFTYCFLGIVLLPINQSRSTASTVLQTTSNILTNQVNVERRTTLLESEQQSFNDLHASTQLSTTSTETTPFSTTFFPTLPAEIASTFSTLTALPQLTEAKSRNSSQNNADGDDEDDENTNGCQVDGVKIKNKLELKKCLMGVYFRLEPPRNKTTTIVTVPMNLLDVDDQDERINLIFDVKLLWNDDRLAWNNTRTVNTPIHVLEFLPEEIWFPTIEIVNRLRSRTQYLIQWIYVASRSDGSTYAHGQFFDDISCKMDAYYYPFDTQLCPLLFAFLYGTKPVSYTNTEGLQQAYKEYLNRFAMQRVGEWEMVWIFKQTEVVPFEKNGLYVVLYPVQVRRSWIQPLMTWVVPPIAISMAGVIALYFGCEPAEHHSFGAAIVITMTLLLTGLYARLPASGTGFPIIGQLYLELSFSILVSMSLSTIRLSRWATASSSVKRAVIKFHMLPTEGPLRKQQLEYRMRATCMVITLVCNVGMIFYAFYRWLSWRRAADDIL